MKKKIVLGVLISVACCGLTKVQANQQVQNYLSKQITVLQKIKPIIRDDSVRLHDAFWEEINSTKNAKPTIAFNIAMSKILKDKSYFKQYYKEELEKRAWILFQDYYNDYKLGNKLAVSSLDVIKPQLEKQSAEIALCELQYLAFPDERFELESKIKEKFQKKISTVTMKQESKGASHDLQLVLEYRTKLRLSNEQVDSIVAGAQGVNDLQNQGIITPEKRNSWEYERKYIMSTLKEDQVSDFITIRNSVYARNYANDVWKDLKKYNIASDYDSIQVLKEVYNYNINKEKIKYIYKDEPDKLKEMNDFLFRSSYPKAIKQLNVEKRKNNNQEAVEKNRLSF
jgi:hypothetical protein